MPEKSLAEIPRPLRELYERGTAAYQRQNWDYAIAILNQVLLKEPAFYECREVLRASQVKKAGAGAGFLKRFLGTASNSPLMAKGQILLRSNPLEALPLAEQILNGDPNSVSAHKLLAEAALEADLPRTAVLSLEIAHKQAPADKEIALRLGEALVRAGQVVKAENVYRELERAYPHDQGIAQALKNVVAKRTMVEGGYDALSAGEGSYRDILKNKAEAVSLEQAKREVKSEDVADRLIRENEARLAKDPQDRNLLRATADLYIQKRNYDRALEYYRRMIEAEGGSNPEVERLIAETTARKFDETLARLDPAAANYAEEKDRMEKEKFSYQIDEARRRVERYPTDLQLRLDLGRLYFQAGRMNEAMQEFQRAQANPHIRLIALNFLGQCFARRGMNDLAVRTFQNAIKEKSTFDEEKKELVYRLGSVLEAMGKKDEAIEQFKLIYEVDIGYRDVAAKVDSFYGQGIGLLNQRRIQIEVEVQPPVGLSLIDPAGHEKIGGIVVPFGFNQTAVKGREFRIVGLEGLGQDLELLATPAFHQGATDQVIDGLEALSGAHGTHQAGDPGAGERLAKGDAALLQEAQHQLEVLQLLNGNGV
jgi:tetratricopeptide (TPR) repeat protein